MNSFQILDSNNEALTMSDLDKEAVEFWGVELSEKVYARPSKNWLIPSWYDMIGYNIANPVRIYNHSTWQHVVQSMYDVQTRDLFIKPAQNKVAGVKLRTVEELADECAQITEFLQPYINLINHWAEKGYKPSQIKN